MSRRCICAGFAEVYPYLPLQLRCLVLPFSRLQLLNGDLTFSMVIYLCKLAVSTLCLDET